MNLYGKQTELALKHFAVGTEKWPVEMIHAQVVIKKAAARVNAKLGVLDTNVAQSIDKAAGEVLSSKYADQFPLSIWQSGSGTQFNMNVNEVLANRATELLARHGNPSSPRLLRMDGLEVHPNDHVNMSQSTNDTIPTAIHIAALLQLQRELSPAIERLVESFTKKSKEFKRIIKIGRTHLQDAVPMTLGQEFSGYARQLEYALEHLQETSRGLRELAIGGTALGTELNAPKGYRTKIIREINTLTGLKCIPAKNLFANMAAHDAVVATSGALKTLAVAVMKIANDIRWLSSGPRAGLSEITFPANEPGSSIMPGKVNPTQSEMVMMVCAQVIGNDTAITTSAATTSNFEMQASKPLLAHALLQSIRLLADAARSFDEHCAQGIEPNVARLGEYAERSLMLVTALNKHIGYDKAAEIAKKAYIDDSTLEDAAIALGYVTQKQFRQWVDAKKMVG